MELNEQLCRMRKETAVCPREEKIRETIEKGKDVYFHQEETQVVSHWEFLWGQVSFLRKRWWTMQALLLLAWPALVFLDAGYQRVRSLSVIGCLFVVLIIPELWRNRETASIQVEAACLYSLRQIYAARIVLFGMADTTMLTLFTLCLGRMGVTPVEIISQFLLPVTVTAGICFSLLRGRKNFGETVSLGVCLLWGGFWWLIMRNEGIYSRIVPAVWTVLLGMALVFLGYSIGRTISATNQYWEVEFA